ncbi:LamG domain-containing protein [Candidatus Poribacteria bacterium]|nr:LamG domain-containing protein [Candidatus Poribacteria bacterium]
MKGGKNMWTKWLCTSILAPVAVCLLVISSSSAIEPGDVAGMWLFDEGGGDKAKDSSGNKNEGKVAGPKWVEGKFGKALSFDGSDDYVDVVHQASLEPKSVSGQAWVKLQNDGTRHIIFAKWTGYTLEVGADGRPYFQIWNGQQLGSTAPVPISWGEWHHLAGTFNDEDKNITIYVDGEAKLTTKLGSGIIYNQSVLRISNTIYTGGAVNGLLDEVAIVNRVLTPADVKTLMNKGFEKMLKGETVIASDKLSTTWAQIKAQY